jgi:universal stress protein A
MKQDVLPNSGPDSKSAAEETVRATEQEADPTFKRILVPIDFSEHSERTISYAAKFASQYEAMVQLLHVFQIPDYVVTPFARRRQHPEQVKALLDAGEQEARENLAAIEQRLSNRGIKVEAYLRVGFPFDEIVRMANHFNVDLIIIGSHGLSPLTRLLVGSTAKRVVEHAPCPVLVVKERRPSPQ